MREPRLAHHAVAQRHGVIGAEGGEAEFGSGAFRARRDTANDDERERAAEKETS